MVGHEVHGGLLARSHADRPGRDAAHLDGPVLDVGVEDKAQAHAPEIALGGLGVDENLEDLRSVMSGPMHLGGGQ